MAEDSFGQNFVWHEWSFVAPEDLGADEADRDERNDAAEPVPGPMGWDTVWKRDHP